MRRLDPDTPQLRPQRVLAPGPLIHQMPPMLDEAAPGTTLDAGHVHRRDLIHVQELGDLPRIVAVVLVFGAEDQLEFRRVGHIDLGGQRPQQVVQSAVPARGLEADLERLLDASQVLGHGGKAALDILLPGDSPGCIQLAKRRRVLVHV